jgi:SAM-dependent methyltransferase
VSDETPRSVAFDRAASFYDASRDTESEDTRREAELVLSELADRDRVLEVGTGTGAMALHLRAAGVRLTAIDLSMPMLRRLVERAGGSTRFALVQADATRMPFADDVFDGALARWVLHLIPNWPDVLAELARVLRPGGVALINTGGAFQGPWAEIRGRMGEEVGRELKPVGLLWQDFDSLDLAADRAGFRPRALRPIRVSDEEPLEEFLTGIERNHYSWTWPLTDKQRLGALAAIRSWAEETYGSLDRPMPMEVDVIWRAYDLPEDDQAAPRAR